MRIQTTLREKDYVFETIPGLFSAERIDPGTRLLIESMEINDGDTVFDFGCGYGVIGLVAAHLCTHGKVYLADVDIRAVKQSIINAKLNHLDNVEVLASDGFAEIPPKEKFDVILANPPNHVAKEILIEFISEAKNRLINNGKIYLVIEKRLLPMYKRLLIGFVVDEIARRGQYVVLRTIK